jgi:hypothetical protein
MIFLKSLHGIQVGLCLIDESARISEQWRLARMDVVGIGRVSWSGTASGVVHNSWSSMIAAAFLTPQSWNSLPNTQPSRIIELLKISSRDIGIWAFQKLLPHMERTHMLQVSDSG